MTKFTFLYESAHNMGMGTFKGRGGCKLLTANKATHTKKHNVCHIEVPMSTLFSKWLILHTRTSTHILPVPGHA